MILVWRKNLNCVNCRRFLSWASMYLGGEAALQADCGGFESHLVHHQDMHQRRKTDWSLSGSDSTGIGKQ